MGCAALLVSVLAAVASCSGDSDDGASPPPPAGSGAPASTGASTNPTNGPAAPASPLATASGTGPDVTGVNIAVTSLRRDSAEMVTLVATVVNRGPEPMQYLRLSRLDGNYNTPSASGVTLIDPVGKLRYYPLRDTARICVCTPFRLGAKLPVGGQIEVTVSFPAPPQNVSSVTVDWQEFTPAAGVRLS
jgi:hypothetical protein